MNDFYLKILSGNHLGAEIPVAEGQYSLGKGQEHDLILTDDSLSDDSFTLDISGQGVLTVISQQPIFLNGSQSGTRVTPEHFDVFTIGGIHFAFGPADTPWPTIEPPLLQPQESHHKKTPSDDVPDTDLEDAFPFDSPQTSEDIQAFSQPKNVSDETNEDDEVFEVNPKLLIALPILFIFLITIFALLLLSDSSEENQINAPLSTLEQATLIQNQLQTPDIKFRELMDGTLLISGYTQTLEQKKAFIQQIKEKKLPFRSQIVVMKDLRANARTLLKNRGYDSLNILADNTPGSIILTGYIISDDQLQKAINLLKEEVYGLNDVVSQVDNQAGRLNVLKAMIKDKGLASRVHLTERPGKVLAQGLLLDTGQQYKLEEVIKRFNTRYNNQPTILIGLKNSKSQSSQGNSAVPAIVSNSAKKPLHPSVTVRGVSMGAIPYVIMADGGKYLLGSKLDNGYIIEDINLDYLLLSGDSKKIKYPLGGKTNVKQAERQ